MKLPDPTSSVVCGARFIITALILAVVLLVVGATSGLVRFQYTPGTNVDAVEILSKYLIESARALAELNQDAINVAPWAEDSVLISPDTPSEQPVSSDARESSDSSQTEIQAAVESAVAPIHVRLQAIEHEFKHSRTLNQGRLLADAGVGEPLTESSDRWSPDGVWITPTGDSYSVRSIGNRSYITLEHGQTVCWASGSLDWHPDAGWIGRIQGTFKDDRTVIREAPITFRRLNATSVECETEFIRWDDSGDEISRYRVRMLMTRQ